MNKTEGEAYNLIKEMTLNNFLWLFERTQPKRVGDKLELDGISMLSYKVDDMSKKLERLDVNYASSITPSPSCDICGLVDHLTLHFSSG